MRNPSDCARTTTDCPRHFATLLSSRCFALPVRRQGKELHQVPIAVTGAWVKGDRKFSITSQDLNDMVRNFEKRRNEQVVVDYEHASEMPEIARGGPIPAAGWIHELSVVRGPSSVVKDNGPRTTDNGRSKLNALIEWTPQAIEMIRGGQYRFFSPAIDWEARDKETGKPQGATLTSGALTNHPFLEELPPIMLTDLGGEFRFSNLDFRRGGKMAKKLTLKKALGAKGQRSVFDDDVELGEIDFDDLDLDDGELEDLAARFGKKFDDDAGPDSMSEAGVARFAAQVGAPGLSLGEIKERLALAENAQREVSDPTARAILMTEAVRGGKLDNARAAVLAREGKITLADYIAAQEAQKAVDLVVLQGKILPRDRAFFFRDALDRPREFAEWAHSAPRVLALDSLGLGSAQTLNVDDEVNARVKGAQKEDPKLSYGQAFVKVLASDKGLAARYHAAHRKHAAEDQPAA